MVAAAAPFELVDEAELLADWSADLSAEVVEAWPAEELEVVVAGAVEASACLLTSAMVGGFWVAQSFWILLLHSSWPSALPALDWMQLEKSCWQMKVGRVWV